MKHFDVLSSKTSSSRQVWLLPQVYEGFNDARNADDLIATQLRFLGKDANVPAEQVAEAIREKAAVRARTDKHFLVFCAGLRAGAVRKSAVKSPLSH